MTSPPVAELRTPAAAGQTAQPRDAASWGWSASCRSAEIAECRSCLAAAAGSETTSPRGCRSDPRHSYRDRVQPPARRADPHSPGRRSTDQYFARHAPGTHPGQTPLLQTHRPPPAAAPEPQGLLPPVAVPIPSQYSQPVHPLKETLSPRDCAMRAARTRDHKTT